MVRPDALDSVRVLAVAFLLVAAVSLVPGGGPVKLGLLQAVFFAVPLVYSRLAGLPTRASNGFVRLSLRQVGLVLLASLGSLWVLKGLAELQEVLLPKLGFDAAQEMETLARRVESGSRLAAMATLAALPALCEETFFRGLLFRGFQTSFGPFRAVLYTTILFAAVHSTLVQTIMMVFAGTFFGVLVWLTGSIWAGVLAHLGNNLAVLVVHHYVGTRTSELRAPPWVVVLSAGVLALALTLLALERRSRIREAQA